MAAFLEALGVHQREQTDTKYPLEGIIGVFSIN